MNCLLGGIDTKALLDSGAQVSVLSRSFLAEQFPDIKVRNVKELLGDQNLELLAVNNLSVPYEGFVEITLTLVGKKDNFSIHVPFLVTPAKIDQTLIGFNVIYELIRANSSENTRELLDAMLSSFNSVDDTQLKTFINFVQECGQNDLCTVKTIQKNFVIPAGKSLKIPCRVDTGPISKRLPVLFERFEEENLPYGLSVHQTLLSISPQSSRIHLQIFNSSNHDIFLPNRTELGRLELVRTVTPLEVNFKGFSQNNFSDDTASTSDSVSHMPDVSVNTLNMKSVSQAKTTDQQDIISQIDLSHLTTEQAQMAREMLSEERDSFSISDSDVGYAEGLQMEINLKDKIPVQKSYQSIPRPKKLR